VQLIGDFAAERVGPGGHQFAQHPLLLLVREPGRVTAAMGTRLDRPVFTVALPDAARRRGRAGHDLGDIVAFQTGLKQLHDPPSHRR